MSDPSASRPVAPRDASPEGHNRRIPPLVWIILAALIAWMIGAAVMRKGIDRTPQGGGTPPSVSVDSPNTPAPN